MQQVAEALGLDVTTFSRQIKTLESKGLVRKSVADDDRRVNLLGLTESGQRTLAQIDLFMEAKIEQIFSTMTLFERDAVTKSLGLLNDALTKNCCC